jgi:hypothetical protein
MHLSLTCLYSHCINLQIYYDHPDFFTASERSASFTYKARVFYVSKIAFQIKCETEI